MTGEMRVGLFYLFVVSLFWTALAIVDVWPFRLGSYLSNFLLYCSAWAIFASVQSLICLYQHRPDRPMQFLVNVPFGSKYRQRVRESLPLLVAAILFMPGFSAMKSAIPLFTDYAWDQSFINLDVALHGQDPWRILQSVLGYPLATSLISAAYHFWILLVYAGTIYFAIYVDDRQLRVRYFAACFGIWTVCGVLLATLFASVGPCFLEPMMGNSHFADQMTYLNAANERYPVMVIEVQQTLIEWHEKGSHGLGRGISAMPSMHVALSFLFFLAIRQVSRILGNIFLVFFVIILVGSVHLAYHYAVDGYVSIVVTGMIWVLSGFMFRSSAEQLRAQPQ